jgi:hypothetical protein
VPGQNKLTVEDLRNWNLLEQFLEALVRLAPKHPVQLHRTFADPRRKLGYASYLSLFLFGLFNPVVLTMRQLCALSELQKVQDLLGIGKVSLGSFSAAQWLVEPDLLKHVFEDLVEQLPVCGKVDPRLAHLQLLAQDGSLWRALPRMVWAEYGVGRHGTAKGVRLHLRFNLLKDAPEDATITPGKGCETDVLRDMLLPGQTNIGDRFYGHDYNLFEDIDQAGAFFVFRIHDQAVINLEEDLPMTQADAAAGVLRHAWVRLGATEKLRSIRVRLVEIRRDGQHLLLVTNHSVEELSAELVSVVYRRRWSIELFFRWIKCILSTRHFFAESQGGVTIQIYLALIASVLLQLFTGSRPTKRVMELIQMYFLGWATAEELARLIPKYSAKRNHPKKS